jgi:hypothetical protein
MNNQPSLENTILNYLEWAIYNAVLYTLIIGLVGPVTITAHAFERKKVRRSVYAVAISLSLL